jgi:hypothetical protein
MGTSCRNGGGVGPFGAAAPRRLSAARRRSCVRGLGHGRAHAYAASSVMSDLARFGSRAVAVSVSSDASTITAEIAHQS